MFLLAVVVLSLVGWLGSAGARPGARLVLIPSAATLAAQSSHVKLPPPGTPAAASQNCFAATAIRGACGELVRGAPSDPDYAQCELEPTVTGCTDNEEWDFYGRLKGNTCPGPTSATPADHAHPDGGLPCWAFNATDPQHAAGLNEPGAWAQGNIGRPQVLIAYMEGGVNYDSDSVKDSLFGSMPPAGTTNPARPRSTSFATRPRRSRTLTSGAPAR